MITVIDYDMGNIGSVVNILHSVGCNDVKVTQNGDDLLHSDGIILPGVGAFDEGIKNLKKYGLAEKIIEATQEENIPLLGICLGMQLLGKSSEEGKESGLGLISFQCRQFEAGGGLKVPHMGWEYVNVKKTDSLITRGLPEIQRYYFVHSFYAECEKSENVLMECDYGKTFSAAVYSGNVFGVQFHPEKSHNFEKKIFRNFIGAQLCDKTSTCDTDFTDR